MNKDEIMHVLRLVALGRLNTPQQEEFCEKLAKVFSEPAAEVAPDAQEQAAAKAKRAKKAE